MMARIEAEHLSSNLMLGETAPLININMVLAILDDDNTLAREDAFRLLDAVVQNRFARAPRGGSSALEDIGTFEMLWESSREPVEEDAYYWAARILKRYRSLVQQEKLDDEDQLLIRAFTKYGKARSLRGQINLKGYGALAAEVVGDLAAASGRTAWPAWKVFGPLPPNNRKTYALQVADAALTNVFMVGFILGDQVLLEEALQVFPFVPSPSAELRLVSDLGTYLLSGEVSSFLKTRVPVFGRLGA